MASSPSEASPREMSSSSRGGGGSSAFSFLPSLRHGADRVRGLLADGAGPEGFRVDLPESDMSDSQGFDFDSRPTIFFFGSLFSCCCCCWSMLLPMLSMQVGMVRYDR